MNTILCFVGYLVIGFTLIQGTLYLSNYNLEEDGLDKWLSVGCMTLMWPMFLVLMVGYWVWISWHTMKHWFKEHL